MTTDKTAIRHAATVLLARDGAAGPEVLMGQRGAKAAFMPNKFVFPGGAVDPGDSQIPLAGLPADNCMKILAEDGGPDLAHALTAAAVRETWEETGLILGDAGTWPDPPADWAGFAATGYRPSAAGLTYVFRAITPKGRPRRFDARFFMARADAIQGDADDFSRASDELSALQWVPIARARAFNLPFITEVVLAEVARLIHSGQPPATVPFFDNSTEESLFRQLGGHALPEPE
ncbi:MAG: NUDIX hydrolase [Qingshengfaniella sp.]